MLVGLHHPLSRPLRVTQHVSVFPEIRSLDCTVNRITPMQIAGQLADEAKPKAGLSV